MTMNQSTALSTPDLDRINEIADHLQKVASTNLPKAIEAGRLLRKCKEGVPHGEWVAWMKSNVKADIRSCQYWMKLSNLQDAGKLRNETVSFLGVKEAIKANAKPRKLPPPEPERKRYFKPSPPPAVIDAEIIDAEPVVTVVDGTKATEATATAPPSESDGPMIPKRIPSYVPSDGMSFWAMARSQLVRINKNDTQRVEALQACIAYCQKRLEEKK
jgi:hypothetical protein